MRQLSKNEQTEINFDERISSTPRYAQPAARDRPTIPAPCLSTLNWQSTFRFQVQTVTTPRTMKKKMLAERSKTCGKPSDRYPLFVSWSDEDQAWLLSSALCGRCVPRRESDSGVCQACRDSRGRYPIEAGEGRDSAGTEKRHWVCSGCPDLRRGRKSLNRRRRVPVLKPRAVVAGLWNRPNRRDPATILLQFRDGHATDMGGLCAKYVTVTNPAWDVLGLIGEEEGLRSRR